MVCCASRKELGADLPAIFAAAKEQALQITLSVAQKWRKKKGNEKVAEYIEERIEECLTCLTFPESPRRRIRTTNGLEHLNQEIKRRARVVRIFPNQASVSEVGNGFGRRAIGGMDYGEALSRDARARGAQPGKVGSRGVALMER